MSTGQRAVIVFFDWEGNRSSGVVTVSVAQRWMDNPIQPNPTRQMLDNPAHRHLVVCKWTNRQGNIAMKGLKVADERQLA